MAQDCDHDNALSLEDSELVPMLRGKGLIFYGCMDCGVFLNEEGDEVSDPTDEVVNVNSETFPPGSRKMGPAGEMAGTLSTSGSQGNGGSPMLLGPGKETMRSGVSNLASEQTGQELLSDDAQTPGGIGKRTSKTKGAQVTPPWGIEGAKQFPGPWNGAPCPNLNLGCPGIIEIGMTLVSQQIGNTYFYKCEQCGIGVALEYKTSSLKQ